MCAVGCTLEVYEHDRYPIELGIPEWLARVEDALFEGMSHVKAMTWPRDFLAAIEPGADLERAKAPFLVHVLRSALGHVDRARYPQVAAAVEGCVALWERADVGSTEWETARSAAESAARSAESAARSAAWSAASAAESAAESARSAARSAAWSAESAAWSAAWSAESAAWSAARSAAYDDFADALLGILRGIRPDAALDGAEGGAAESVAISINQPWAGLIVLGLKDIENRDWPTRRRGPVLIHAGLKVDRDAQQSIAVGRHPVTGLPFSSDQIAVIKHHRATHAFRVGGIVGEATVIDCVSDGDTRSTWFTGRYGFVLIHARVLPFRPCKGALNFFRPDFESRYAEKSGRSRLAAPASGGAPGGAGRAGA